MRRISVSGVWMAAWLLAGTADAGPDAPDRVELGDGRVLEGRVLVEEAGLFVEIELEAGRRVAVPWTRVRRVLREGAQRERAAVLSRQRVGVAADVPLIEAEKRREAWRRRGGWLASYEIRAQGVFFVGPEKEFTTSERCAPLPDGRVAIPNPPTTSTHRDGGGGGGGAARLGIQYLALPDADQGHAWVGLRLAAGFEANTLALKVFSAGNDAGPDWRGCVTSPGRARSTTVTQQQYQVPILAGLHVGLGSLDADHRWNGLVVGLTYAPSYQYSSFSVDGESHGSGAFNPAGFELSFDYASLEATLEKYGSAAHFRFSLFVLPPLGANGVWLGTVGVGAAWY